MRKIRAKRFLQSLFFSLILLLMNPLNMSQANEEAKTFYLKGISQIVWLNNSEMLILDKSTDRNILRYNITTKNIQENCQSKRL